MKQNVAIFLGEINIPNISVGQLRDITECDEMGTIYSDLLQCKGRLIYKPQREIIKTALKSQLYDWVVGLYDSATILLSYKGYKKILINPKITYNDLNNIVDYEIWNTYGFFDSEHKKEYKLFQSAYAHSVLFSKVKGLRLSDIKETVSEILTLSQLDLI